MSMQEDLPARLPTGLWVDAECAKLNAQGQGYYITQTGNHHSGVVLVKLFNRQDRTCTAYIQQRNLEGELGWVYALCAEPLAEFEVDAYIRSEMAADPDLWVIEIEADTLDNPFDGKLFDEF